MELKVRKVGGPDQRRQIVYHAVVDAFFFALAWDSRRPDPSGSMRGTTLLIEEKSLDTVRITLERNGPSLQMRQEHRRDANVIVDDLRFCEAHFWIQHLVEV